MKVKCIANKAGEFEYDFITIGKEYEVCHIFDYFYQLKNDEGENYTYEKYLFEIVEDCNQEQQTKEPEEQQFKAMKFKVGSEEESEMIQKVLFEMEYKWAGEYDTWTVKHSDARYLYCHTDGKLYFGNADLNFDTKQVSEYTLKLVPTIVKKEIEYVSVEGYKAPKEALMKFLSENCKKEE